MPQIHALETVSLRDVFPNEAQDFTPWLANHLHLLESKLNLTLQLVKVEATLPEAGRVDILAQQVNTEAIVVIENQLGLSDDSHCLRLMGYAASAEANILVWVAQDFTDYHRSILSWLNESDTIAVYAVAVRAYRVADAIAADFQLVVEPPQSQPGATPTSTRMNTNTFYADFYRPVVAQLRRSDMFPVGRGGFRGRWRSFQTGYPEIFYVAGLSEGKALAHLSVYGADNQHIYHALTQHRADIDARLNNGAEWEEGKDYSRIGLRTEAVIGDPKPDLETVGDWIAENLVRLRDVVQPYLDEMMNDAATSGDNEDAEWS
ncbi:MAG: DUF4268 domain-containing protein [Chloroflexi bacterium]|nr:DUF4268 domain-containing protein [Chloroflexota bacterium]